MGLGGFSMQKKNGQHSPKFVHLLEGHCAGEKEDNMGNPCVARKRKKETSDSGRIRTCAAEAI
jgi:hypothetical protein